MGDAAARDDVRDRELIRAVISRYCHAVDRRDHEAIRTCFTDDVHAEYGGRVVGDGVDELMAWFKGANRDPNPNLPSGRARQGMHFLGDVEIELHGNTASTEAYATIYRVEVGRPDRLVVRGVRYLDVLRRDQGEWRIADRLHTADWAYETVAALGVDPDDRVQRGTRQGGSS